MDFPEAVFDRAPVAILRMNNDEIVAQANQAFCRQFGYEATELYGRHYHEIADPQDARRFSAACKHLLDGESDTIEIDQRYLHKDGSSVRATVTIVAVRDARQDFPCFLAYVTNVSLETPPGPEHDSWEDVFQHAHWGVVLGSADGDLLEQMNPAFARMHGYTVQELTGRPIIDVFAPQCRADVPEQIRIAHRLGHHSFESLHLRKDGTIFPVLIDITAVRGTDGGVKYRVVNVQDISAAKAATKAVQHFATIVESSDDAIVGKTPEGIVTSWNRGAENVFGYRASEMIGKPIDILIPDEHKGEERVMLARIRNNETVKNYETVRRRKYGALIDVSVTVSPIRDAGGRVIGVSKVARDITEHRQAQRALQDTERQLRTLVENIPDPIVRFDSKCRHLYVNSALVKVFDARPEDFIGKTVAEVRLPQRAHEYSCIDEGVRPAFADGQLKHSEVKWVVGDEERYFELIHIPEKDSSGNVVSILSMARDVTDCRRMEETLLYRENKFRTLAENSPNIILRYDRDCRCVYVNPAYSKETGIPLADGTGDAPDSQWEGNSRMPLSEYKTTLIEVMETGRPAEIVVEWTRPDRGEPACHAFHVVAEYGPDHAVLGALVIGHNITALKQAERNLEKSHGQLRGLAARLESVREEERKRIARDMHDDLGQYLTALRMGVSVLPMYSEIKDSALLDQVRDLRRLVDNTITVVRNMAASLRPAPLDMGIVSALEWLTEEFFGLAGVPCRLELNDEKIDLDDDRSTAVFRMVQESLTNVVRHARAQQVAVRLVREKAGYRLTVADDGNGFDVSQPKSKSYGLVGIRERAIMFGGDVSIISAPGEGTTVEMYIPASSLESSGD